MGLFSAITDAVSSAVDLVQDAVNGVVDIAQEMVNGTVDTLQDGLEAVIGDTFLSDIIDGIQFGVNGAVDLAQGGANFVLDGVQDGASYVAEGYDRLFDVLIPDVVEDAVGDGARTLAEILAPVGNGVLEGGRAVASAIGEGSEAVGELFR